MTEISYLEDWDGHLFIIYNILAKFLLEGNVFVGEIGGLHVQADKISTNYLKQFKSSNIFNIKNSADISVLKF